MHYLYLMTAILAEVIATTALKSANAQRPGLIALVVAGYGIAFYCLALSLQTIKVGSAYAIWSGMGIVLISLLGILIHKQPLDLAGIIGLGLIIIGVVVLNLFSNMTIQ